MHRQQLQRESFRYDRPARTISSHACVCIVAMPVSCHALAQPIRALTPALNLAAAYGWILSFCRITQQQQATNHVQRRLPAGIAFLQEEDLEAGGLLPAAQHLCAVGCRPEHWLQRSCIQVLFRLVPELRCTLWSILRIPDG